MESGKAKKKLPLIGIYAITNLINGKMYIGKAVDIPRRWATHRKDLKKGNHPSQHLQRSWTKNGEENFSFTILTICDIDRLDEEERRLIKEHQSNKESRGYNKTEGGGGILGMKHTPEARAKISAAGIGNKYSLGKKLSEEHKKKISLSGTGKKRSKAFKRKMSRAATGRKHTDETREKIKQIRTGAKTPETTKKKLSKLTKKQWSCPEFRKKMLEVLERNRAKRWGGV